MPAHFEAVSSGDTAETRMGQTGTRRKRLLFQTGALPPLLRQLSWRLLILQKPVTCSEVKNAQQQHQGLQKAASKALTHTTMQTMIKFAYRQHLLERKI